MNLKTPEERRASAQKAVATRRANLDRIAKAREEALVYADGLRIKIVALEIRLTELCQGEKMSTVSAALTNKALLTYEEIVKVALPWKLASGVYFLIQDDKVVYVGQSVNVYSRIAQHVDKQFDKYAFVPCDVDLLNKLESLYIHVLKPKLNGNLNAQEKSAPIRFNELLSMV
jgi:hypothetical protein